MHQNLFEVWSEAVLLGLNYLMMVFLNPNVKEESQFYAGVAFASIVTLYFLVDAILMIRQTFHSIKLLYGYFTKNKKA